MNLFYEIYKLHPFQSFYFNKLVGKDIHKKYELDYWGLAGKKSINEIFALKKEGKINVGVASWVPLERSLVLFENSEKKRINIVGQNFEQAEFIFLILLK